MDAPELLFNFFVALAFACAILDHWFIGRGFISVPLRCCLLGCFIYTEGYLASTAQPMMWLYVTLNMWGLLTLYTGRRSPLRRHAKSAAAPLGTSSPAKSGGATTATKSGRNDGPAD